MSTTYADNFYDCNLQKVFAILSDSKGVFHQPDFDIEMDKLKDERLNELWEENEKLKEEIEQIQSSILSTEDDDPLVMSDNYQRMVKEFCKRKRERRKEKYL